MVFVTPSPLTESSPTMTVSLIKLPEISCYISEIDGALVIEIDGNCPSNLRVNMNDTLVSNVAGLDQASPVTGEHTATITATLCGHWSDADEIEIDYWLDGDQQDTRRDVGQWEGGLFAASSSGADLAEIERNIRAEYES